MNPLRRNLPSNMSLRDYDHFTESAASVDSPIKDSDSWGDSLDDSETCPYGCCETQPLNDYILKKGFFGGVCSDITLRAFGKQYPLHKLILNRSGYFSSLFCGPWNEQSEKIHELTFDDHNITEASFDIALAKLYGAAIPETKDVSSLIAVGQYLDIQDLVCSATDLAIKSIDFSNVVFYANFAFNNDYGKASSRIVDSCVGFLCYEGWQAGIKRWDGLPSSIIAAVVGLDSFFVPSEWERALFIIKLIERRQKNKDEDHELIVEALNTKVHFCHLTAEQLDKLESWENSEGLPHVRSSVLKDALWLSVSLHKKVVTADDHSYELGITKMSDELPDERSSWFVPTKDETLNGTPLTISEMIKEHHYLRDDLPNGKTTENSGGNMYKVTKIPPFRFSIAFTNVSQLQPERRVYAKTLWYAGSYWNLYIQKMKHRKGFQIGVYIHRASNAAPSKSGLLNPDIFSVSSSTESSEFHDIADNLENLSLKVDLTPTSELDGPEVYEEDGDEDSDDAYEESREDASFLTYEDGRIKTSLYYVIYTPSRKAKTSLTCFISTPDLFKKSQSWGWKSNSMCSFNEDGTLAEGQDDILKFMVTLGNT